MKLSILKMTTPMFSAKDRISVILRIILCALSVSILSCSQPPKIERGTYPLPKDVEVVSCKVGKYGGMFVLAVSQEPKTFNPLIASDAYSADAISMLLSPLVSYDPFTQENIPALAKSWKISEDGKTYTFFLREGVKFSDGADFTADDVEFTFDTIFAPQTDATGNVVLDKSSNKPLLKYPSRYAGQFTIGGEYIK